MAREPLVERVLAGRGNDLAIAVRPSFVTDLVEETGKST